MEDSLGLYKQWKRVKLVVVGEPRQVAESSVMQDHELVYMGLEFYLNEMRSHWKGVLGRGEAFDIFWYHFDFIVEIRYFSP